MEKSPRKFSYFRYLPQNNFESSCDKENSTIIRDYNPKNKGTSNPSNVQQGKAPVERQNNQYAKLTRDTCYRCNVRCYKSNVYPTRRVVVVEEEREEKEQRDGHALENDEYVRVNFAKKQSNVKVNFVLQRILLASKHEGKHKNLFKTLFYQEKVV